MKCICASLFRCTNCLTKIYCSKECLKIDWEVKHKELCKENAEDRKVKEDSKVRRQTLEERCERIKLSVSGLALDLNDASV